MKPKKCCYCGKKITPKQNCVTRVVVKGKRMEGEFHVDCFDSFLEDEV